MERFRLPGTFGAYLLLLNFFSPTAHAAAVSGQGTWESTLLARDFDGDTSTIEGWYDTVLNITWLADANAAVGSAYDTYSPGSGLMNWTDANAWAASLDINGIIGWRLPETVDIDSPGCSTSYTGVTGCGWNVDTSTGEMASMFYDTLGNLAYYDTAGNGNQPGWGLTNTGPFDNLIYDAYWSATPYGYNPAFTAVFFFDFYDGDQNLTDKSYGKFAWAVHDGDVGTTTVVPVPAVVWLFASGLFCLVGLGRQCCR